MCEAEPGGSRRARVGRRPGIGRHELSDLLRGISHNVPQWGLVGVVGRVA